MGGMNQTTEPSSMSTEQRRAALRASRPSLTAKNLVAALRVLMVMMVLRVIAEIQPQVKAPAAALSGSLAKAKFSRRPWVSMESRRPCQPPTASMASQATSRVTGMRMMAWRKSVAMAPQLPPAVAQTRTATPVKMMTTSTGRPKTPEQKMARPRRWRPAWRTPESTLKAA